MAAPSGTVWGSTVNDYGKIGLYVTTSNATASVSVSVQVWLATKYSCSAWGHLYFNDNATSASTLISNMIDIETYENSGSGWSSSNQILLYSTSFTVQKTTSAQTRNVAAKLDNVTRVGGVMTVKTSYSVGAYSSSSSGTSTTIKPTASKERDRITATSWANYSYDADCASYDGGYTIRIGGSNSSKDWQGWYTFPTGSSFLDPAKYTITAASYKVYQPYFASANGYSGSGTIRARIGKMTVSGTNGLSSTSQTVTTAAKTTDGTWYTYSNILTGAQALQSGSANGIYMDVSDWSSKYWYSRLTYHGGSSYYPQISLTYTSKKYTLTVPSISNATVSGGGTFVWGTTVSVSCTPKTGYHFSKWTLSGGSTATSTSASWSFTMPTANTTATASVAANTYSVKYNANGGSGSMSNSSHTYGTAKALTANAFTRSGYTFNGWNTQADGSGQSYSNSQSVSNLTATHGGTVNLYAQWKANGYTLSIRPNGGTYNGSASNATVSGTVNSTTTVAAPTRFGYIFAGWYKTAYGSLSNSRNRHPVFSGQNNEVGVYNNNGNGVVTHTMQADTSAGYDYTIKITTASDNAQPGFGGFYSYLTSAASKSYIHVFRAKIPTGYAVQFANNAVGDNPTWEWLTTRNGTGAWKDYAYRLTTSSSGSFNSFGYVYLEKLSSAPVTWYLGGTQITTSPTSSQTFTFGSGNTTLYAQWVPEKFTITYDNNGGSGGPGTETAYYGSGYTVSSNIPTKPGYTFAGWKDTYNGQTFAAGAEYPSGWLSNGMVAQWTPNSYTLTLDANGGTVSSTTQSYTYGNTISLPTPTKTGHTFNGWEYNVGGTNYLNLGRAYMYSNKISIHLEAYMDNWVDYSSNDMRLISCTESGGWNFMESVDGKRTFVIYDGAYGYRSGYASSTVASISAGWHSFDFVFDGSKAYSYIDGTQQTVSDAFAGKIYYNTTNSIFVGQEAASANNTPASYGQFSGKVRNVVITDSNSRNTSASNKFSAPAQNFTLTAGWTANTYTITYNANGGSGAPSAQTYTYASSGNVTLSSTTPTRSGYTFLGWSTSSTATSASYSAGGNFSKATASNTTLYAIWRKTITITYNANNGSGAPSASTDYIYNDGTSVSITLSSTTPTRTGYTFLGWSTSSSATSSSYSAGTAYSFSANTTLYAVWQINQYTITINNSSYGTVKNGSTAISSGGKVNYGTVLTVTPTAATGYTTTVASSTGTISSNSLTVDGNETITFTRTAITYSVKYNGNGSTSGSMSNSSHTYDVAKALTANAFSRVYTVTYDANGGSVSSISAAATATFKGWSTNSSATTATYTDKQSVSNLSSTNGATVNLYAIWALGSVTLPTPTRTGYTFKGWSTSSSATSGSTGSYTPTSSVTLYATWQANTYSVSYNANGGSGAPSATSYTYASSGTVNLSSTKPTRAGYTFLGWGTSTSDTSVNYAAGAAYPKNVASNVTLYAIWDYIGIVRIGSNKYLPYAYINGVWQRVMPYIYDTSTSKWKETGSNS